ALPKMTEGQLDDGPAVDANVRYPGMTEGKAQFDGRPPGSHDRIEEVRAVGPQKDAVAPPVAQPGVRQVGQAGGAKQDHPRTALVEVAAHAVEQAATVLARGFDQQSDVGGSRRHGKDLRPVSLYSPGRGRSSRDRDH